MVIQADGNVGIGFAHFCRAVVKSFGWCDFVFDKEYNLMPLDSLEQFVNENKHLPDIPSASDVQENDIDVGDMINNLLKKVEELTLYTIEQQKQIDKQQAEIEKFKKQK